MCGVLLVFLLVFSVMSVTAELPENIVEFSNQGSTSTFYLEDEEKIEIYTCSILTVNKTEIYPEEDEEEVEEEPENNQQNEPEEDNDPEPDREPNNDVTGRIIINPPDREPDIPNNDETSFSSSNEEGLDDFFIEEFGVGCNPSWFCKRWESCFMDKADCYRVAQENDCNYDKLYKVIVDCTTKDGNLTLLPAQEADLSERQKMPFGLAFGVVAVPLISMFALDRYLRMRKQKVAKDEEDKKIEEIRQKYSDE
jgi:hypothetical protein